MISQKSCFANRELNGSLKVKNCSTLQKYSGTMKKISGARITNVYGSAAEAHAQRYYGLVREIGIR